MWPRVPGATYKLRQSQLIEHGKGWNLSLRHRLCLAE